MTTSKSRFVARDSKAAPPTTLIQVAAIMRATGVPAKRIARELYYLLIGYGVETAGFLHYYTSCKERISDLLFLLADLEQRGVYLGDRVERILRPPIHEPPAHQRARLIMGQNYFGLHEASVILGNEDFCGLEDIPFSEQTLKRFAKSHVLLVDPGISMRRMAHNPDADYHLERFLPDFGDYTEGPTWRLVPLRAYEHSSIEGFTPRLLSMRAVAWMFLLGLFVQDRNLLTGLFFLSRWLQTATCSDRGYEFAFRFQKSDGIWSIGFINFPLNSFRVSSSAAYGYWPS